MVHHIGKNGTANLSLKAEISVFSGSS